MAVTKIDPVNRIEGHLSCVIYTPGTTNTTVTGCNMKGAMFRGWENILVGRDATDPMIICQRI